MIRPTPPWDGWSNLDRLDGLDTRGPAPLLVAVRPIAHRRRSTHVRLAVKWGEVVSMVALFAAIALMSGIVAAIALRLVGA